MLVDVLFAKTEDRTLIKLPPYIAPFVAGIFPLQHDEAIEKASESLYKKLKSQFKVEYDVSGSIGRRYARMDEVGTPFCITIDYETVDKASANHGTVTVRHRDEKKQERIKTEDVEEFLAKNIKLDVQKFY